MSIGTIEELKRKKCQPCEGGVPPVPREEADRLLKDLPGWELTEDGKRIRRDWRPTQERFHYGGQDRRFADQVKRHLSPKKRSTKHVTS